MGLKPAIGLLGIIAAIQGSNRTIVGLKRLSLVGAYGNKKEQQSHHCGIETSDFVSDSDDSASGSNRTIVGLKQRRHR